MILYKSDSFDHDFSSYTYLGSSMQDDNVSQFFTAQKVLSHLLKNNCISQFEQNIIDTLMSSIGIAILLFFSA